MNKNEKMGLMAKALFDTDLVLMRLMLGFSEIVWFILLILPGTNLDIPFYTEAGRNSMENYLAFVFLATGLLQFYVVYSENFHSAFARVHALFTATLWVCIIISIFFSVEPPPAQISGEIALMLGAIWVWARPIILYHGIKNARKQS